MKQKILDSVTDPIKLNSNTLGLGFHLSLHFSAVIVGLFVHAYGSFKYPNCRRDSNSPTATLTERFRLRTPVSPMGILTKVEH